MFTNLLKHTKLLRFTHTFCVCVCLLWLSEQKAIISLNSINRTAFAMLIDCVLCEVENKLFLYYLDELSGQSCDICSGHSATGTGVSPTAVFPLSVPLH